MTWSKLFAVGLVSQFDTEERDEGEIAAVFTLDAQCFQLKAVR